MVEVKKPIVTKVIELDPAHVQATLGIEDNNLKALEEHVRAEIVARGTKLTITGPDVEVVRASRVLYEMSAAAKAGRSITPESVRHTVGLVRQEAPETVAQAKRRDIVSRRGKTVRAVTRGQQEYVDAIDNNTIVFGIGPAGTGKTYLAMAKAVQYLQAKKVQRIILTRPAAEAGEKLGFLPGTLGEKIDPYLRPLSDALHDMVDQEAIGKLLESGIVEVAPLAYMRGRTLNDAFVILDEAQNTTAAQMKMFLTRLGFGSTMVVTGDITQVDLPGGQRSGLRVIRDILEGIDGIHFSDLTSSDVVRHQLVGRIVAAYDRYEQEHSTKR